MANWQEKMSRGLAKMAMNNFTSVADALQELVDNPIDYWEGQTLCIQITHDPRRDLLIVESDGGRGMGEEEISVWLNWGEGEEPGPSDIRRYHQGGKAACGFLAGHVRLYAKKRGSEDIWLLEDENWASRSEPKDFGEPSPLSREKWPTSMQGLPIDRGHVRIELTKLAQGRRWNLEVLKRSLSNTYRTLLSNGRVRITVGPEELKPVDIPLSTATKKIEISPIKLTGGRSARGWAGRMMRNQLTRQLKAGMRLVLNGRLIMEGEWFGYNYQGKGSLNSLIGELELSSFIPSPNKTDFVDRADVVWDKLGEEVVKQLQPLISELRQAGEETRVTKEEKERVREVALELGEVLKALSEGDGFEESLLPGELVEAAPGGRKRAEAGSPREPVKNPRGPNRNPRTPRTPPPEDPVGSINRLLARINGGRGQPPLRIGAWDETERSALTTEGTQAWLDINKNYPLYDSLRGAKPYLAETAVLELCKPREGEALSAVDYIGKVDLILLRWSQLNTEE